jgi:hypothetical protein
VLFHGARTDFQLVRDVLVAAALHQQVQDLLVALRYLDFAKIDHCGLHIPSAIGYPTGTFARHASKCFAKVSLSGTLV